MVRIGVLSDTHLADTGESACFLKTLYEDVFAPVDMILHAGDLVAPELLSVFTDCPVYAVRGNMDPSSPDMPVKRVISVGGFRIGMMHGWGPPGGLVERLLDEFGDIPIDCLVYGHSHRPHCETHDGILLFNPGSATDRREMSFHSVGLLELDSEINGSIIPLD